jgi:hypothetical protein
MMQAVRTWAAALLVIGLAAAGAVAGARSDAPGLATLFGVIGLVTAASLWPARRRRAVELRPDLARWLDDVAAVTSEPAGDVLDRSLSAYRASMQRSRDG